MSIQLHMYFFFLGQPYVLYISMISSYQQMGPYNICLGIQQEQVKHETGGVDKHCTKAIVP